MKNKIKQFNISSLGHFFVKNVLLLIGLFVILIILSGIFICNNFMEDSDKKAVEAITTDVNVLKSQSDGAFSKVVQQMQSISVNLDINNMIKKNMNEEFYRDKYSVIVELLQKTFGGISFLDNVYFYSEYRDYIMARGGTLSKKNYRGLSWLDNYELPAAQSTDGFYRKAYEDGMLLFTLVYCIADRENASGMIIAEIDLREHMRFYSKNDTTILVDREKNEIFYNSNYDMSNEVALKLVSGKNGITKCGDDYYIMVRCPSEYQSFDYAIISKLENYSAERAKIYLSVILVLILLVILFSVVSYYLSKFTYKPISELSALADNPFSEKSKKYLESDVNTKKIADRLFLIVSSNETLKNELSTKMETLNYAQLKALQWQINPHFIFNTLNMLYYLSEEMNGAGNGVSKGVMSLSKLMRYCLKTEPMIVEAHEEINLANEYVKIMKARLGDEFELNWDFDEKFRNKRIVKMILQPILENCFRYGFKNIDYKGVINISANETEEFFEITVSDNGVGIEETELEKINAYLRKPPEITEVHVGFSNVNSRIVLTYGEKYGVTVLKNEPQGVRVLLKLPKEGALQN